MKCITYEEFLEKYARNRVDRANAEELASIYGYTSDTLVLPYNCVSCGQRCCSSTVIPLPCPEGRQ